MPPDALPAKPAAATSAMQAHSANMPFVRLWHGFLTGRVLIAACLLVLQLLLSTPGDAPASPWPWVVCLGYLVLAVVLRVSASAVPPAPQVGLHWLPAIGVDIAAIALLQGLQSGPLNYSALLAIPILIAAVLGSLTLAFATTASVTLCLLGYVIWQGLAEQISDDRIYYQSGFACAGYFVIAYLTHELARRVRRERVVALQNRIQAQNQKQINDLITRQLGDGVLVVSGHTDPGGGMHWHVRQANPAALRLLGLEQGTILPLALDAHDGWHSLHAAVAQSFARGQAIATTLQVQAPGQQASTGVQVRTWLTQVEVAPALDPEGYDAAVPPQTPSQQCLCLVFLRDLREMEAQIRTEKLAAMGRMSTAVAHEIRNPLAAIVQANALLAEDDSLGTAQQGLCRIVAQNARRLDRTVEDILNAARVQHKSDTPAPTEPLALDAQVEKICREWQHQADPPRLATLQLRAADQAVVFDGEHLRRILVNLMDNAQRYRSNPQCAHTLQITTGVHRVAGHKDMDAAEDGPGEHVWLQVWSDGNAIEASVQRHLFEPFFSSESRSSGLGLYLSRTLCQHYGASIDYLRLAQPTPEGTTPGNAFRIVFRGSGQ